MALNLDKIKSRLNSLSNQDANKKLFWKPVKGKQVIRIVPYKFNPENPFIELKFHYGLAGKTYISPDTFGRPDPVVEFANKLKKTGDKEDWKKGRALEPKLRTYVPIIVRGQENEGVKFWGFGKTVYEDLLSIIDDAEYGDITDLTAGHDIVVEFKEAVETGKNYPDTSVRAKPSKTPAVDPANKELIALLGKQVDIVTLYEEKSYAELKDILKNHLNPSESSDNSGDNTDTGPSPEESDTPKAASATKVPSSNKDIESAFDNLFNS
jgi:gp32 DNA binding protein like